MLLQPERSVRIGTAVYGLAMVGFGLICVLPISQLPQLEPLPDWLPAHSLAAVLTAAIFIIGGALLAADRFTSQAAAWIGGLFAVWLVALHVPLLVAEPRNGGEWVLFFEVLAIGSVAWTLRGCIGDGRTSTHLATGARLAFGLSLVAFGCSHFYYLDHVSHSIPDWIPGHVFLAYLTGVAHIAGGVSVMTRIKSRLAGALLAIMFGSWVFLIWIPRVMAMPAARGAWMNTFIAVAMSGGSLLVGECAARSRELAQHVPE